MKTLYTAILSITILFTAACGVNIGPDEKSSTDNIQTNSNKNSNVFDQIDQNELDELLKDIDEQEPIESYEEEILESYKAVLPKKSVLMLATPIAEDAEGVVTQALMPGERAIYPYAVYPSAMDINKTVISIIEILEFITTLPPTFYNSQTGEFVWGPYEDHDSPLENDTFTLYIKDNGENSEKDFRYEYALMRGMGRDQATFVTVIFGGSNPDANNEEYGSGIILWDFEAASDFEETNNPNHGNLSKGRFITVYSNGPDENNADNEVSMVLAVYRNFVPEDEPENPPVDINYFYGRVNSEEAVFDFLDAEVNVQMEFVGDNDNVEFEHFHAKLAFVNEGLGRAEVYAKGDDISEDPRIKSVAATECWDENIMQTYIQFIGYDESDNETGTHSQGSLNDCQPFFQQTLNEAGMPTLDDLDEGLMSQLDNAAQNGIN